MARKSTKPTFVTDSPSNQSGMAVTHSDIAALAFALWQERGCPEGSSEEDWYEAERKLQSQVESQATFA